MGRQTRRGYGDGPAGTARSITASDGPAPRGQAAGAGPHPTTRMAVIRPRSALRHRRPTIVGALVAILVAGVMPGPPTVTARDLLPDVPSRPAVPAPDAPDDAPDDVPEDVPSIAYEEWLEHEDDELEFTPGARVEVGFTPRKDDRWPVGGAEPGPLPAGRASGRDMAKMPNGSRWTDVGGKGTDGRNGRGAGEPAEPSPAQDPVDAPAGAAAVPANLAAFAEPAAEPDFDLAAASGLRRQVYGFLPYWELSGASTKLNYDVLSTIAYFSVGATSKGNLKKKDADGTSTTGWGGWTSSNMTRVINAAHQKGTRVVLTVSVFAWTSSQASVQKALLGSSTARLNLVKQTVAAVRDRGADGVNLDFEPLASGYGDEFVALLKTFRSEFNKIRSGYQIVYDTTGYIGNYPLEASVGKSAADAIFVMGYDYRTSGSATSGSIDPLSGPKYDLADTVRAYTSRVSPSRVILGIPWYGRAWSTASDTVRSKNISGLKHGYSSAVNYESVVAYVEKYGRRWDSSEQSPYVVYRRKNCTDTYGCVTSWRQIYYDDASSMKRRYALVNDYGLRGTGMWALGYDGGHSELYRALSDSFLVDKAAPVAGIRNVATTQVDEGFVVKWAARDVSSVVSYDVQVSRNGGAWETWLTGTRATSDVFLGSHGTGYAFRVRAKDSKGHLGSWNVSSTWTESPKLAVGGFGRVLADGLSYRTGPDTSAARLGALDAGTLVAVTRGPVSADGYTWYEVTQPIKEWSAVSFVERGVWVAASNSSTTFIKAYRAPNSTTVKAGIRDLDFGSASTSAVGTASSQVATRSFSPNGDGSKDALKLRWRNGVAMDTLTLYVYRTDGTLAGSRRVPDRAAGAQSWNWDGKIDGTRVKDGTYVLQLRGVADGKTYRAPSSRPATAAQIALYRIRVDTAGPSITASSVQYKLLSPNGDGTRDTTKLSVGSKGASRWSATITNAAGSRVRTASGTGGTVAFTWNGLDDAGTRVADGRYTATLAVSDMAGNIARRSWTLTVDTTAPTVKPATSYDAFSPNGDGTRDTTVLSWSSSERASGTARLWKGTTLIRSWRVSGLTAWKATWDGRRADGTRVADGKYTFKVDVRDAAGNRRRASTTVVVDRTATALRWSRHFFPQDKDAIRPTSRLSYALSRDATTTLRLYDRTGALVRTVWKGKDQSAGARGWTWNGKLADGTYAPQGKYKARLTVTSRYSKLELTRWVWATAFTVTPSATTVKPGQTLTVRFTSIEPLGTKPVVTFTQPGRTGVTVTATKLADGSYKATFSVKSGAVGSGRVKVSAKDADGRTNSTSIAIKVAS